MYYLDHTPPHFHAKYGDNEVLIRLDNLNILKGNIPERGMRLVLEWAKKNLKLLEQNWQNAIDHKKLQKIPSLD